MTLHQLSALCVVLHSSRPPAHPQGYQMPGYEKLHVSGFKGGPSVAPAPPVYRISFYIRGIDIPSHSASSTHYFHCTHISSHSASFTHYYDRPVPICGHGWMQSPSGLPCGPDGQCDCGAGLPCGEYLWDHRNDSLRNFLIHEFIGNNRYTLNSCTYRYTLTHTHTGTH